MFDLPFIYINKKIQTLILLSEDGDVSILKNFL